MMVGWMETVDVAVTAETLVKATGTKMVVGQYSC
jgi:hypothetical protein